MAKNRLEILKRRAAGRSVRQKLEQKLFSEGNFRKGRCKFLDLEESDAVMEINRTRFAPRHKEITQQNEAIISLSREQQIPLGKLQAISSPIPSDSTNIYVVFLDSDKIGVLTMPSAEFCGHWQDLVQIEPDGFVVLEQDFHNKVTIQVIDAGSEEGVLDIGVWGDYWSKEVRKMANREPPTCRD